MSLIVESIRPKSPAATKTRSPQPEHRERGEPATEQASAPQPDGVGKVVDRTA